MTSAAIYAPRLTKRPMRRTVPAGQTVRKDERYAKLFDTDPVVQRYIHALKRLVTHMQTAAPADPSKSGHVPPAAAATLASEAFHRESVALRVLLL